MDSVTDKQIRWLQERGEYLQMEYAREIGNWQVTWMRMGARYVVRHESLNRALGDIINTVGVDT